MRSPRRIFRRGVTSGPGRIALAAGSGLVLLIVVAAVASVLRALPLTAGTPNLPKRLLAEAREVSVIDGDTLLLRDTVVRLAGIVAPSRGAPCPRGIDCGGAAASVLAGLVRDRRLDCRLQGEDALGRPFAACDASGFDLSSAVVSRGWARVQPDSPALSRLETDARARQAGIWARSGL